MYLLISYLSCQYVFINGYEYGLAAAIKFGVPLGSVLGPLIVLLYIHDFNLAMKYCKVDHFADDYYFEVPLSKTEQTSKC